MKPSVVLITFLELQDQFLSNAKRFLQCLKTRILRYSNMLEFNNSSSNNVLLLSKDDILLVLNNILVCRKFIDAYCGLADDYTDEELMTCEIQLINLEKQFRILIDALENNKRNFLSANKKDCNHETIQNKQATQTNDPVNMVTEKSTNLLGNSFHPNSVDFEAVINDDIPEQVEAINMKSLGNSFHPTSVKDDIPEQVKSVDTNPFQSVNMTTANTLQFETANPHLNIPVKVTENTGENMAVQIILENSVDKATVNTGGNNPVQTYLNKSVDMATVAKARLEINKVRKGYQRDIDPDVSEEELKVMFPISDL